MQKSPSPDPTPKNLHIIRIVFYAWLSTMFDQISVKGEIRMKCLVLLAGCGLGMAAPLRRRC